MSGTELTERDTVRSSILIRCRRLANSHIKLPGRRSAGWRESDTSCCEFDDLFGVEYNAVFDFEEIV